MALMSLSDTAEEFRADLIRAAEWKVKNATRDVESGVQGRVGRVEMGKRRAVLAAEVRWLNELRTIAIIPTKRARKAEAVAAKEAEGE